jgi:hypothetical protein
MLHWKSRKRSTGRDWSHANRWSPNCNGRESCGNSILEGNSQGYLQAPPLNAAEQGGSARHQGGKPDERRAAGREQVHCQAHGRRECETGYQLDRSVGTTICQHEAKPSGGMAEITGVPKPVPPSAGIHAGRSFFSFFSPSEQIQRPGAFAWSTNDIGNIRGEVRTLDAGSKRKKKALGLSRAHHVRNENGAGGAGKRTSEFFLSGAKAGKKSLARRFLASEIYVADGRWFDFCSLEVGGVVLLPFLVLCEL